MSLKDDLISKHISPGTGALGIKGIKPVGRKAPVCTKTLTKDGLRVRYICPPSGGKQAVRSLESLPFKPEDVPEKIQEVKTFSPEQQYTPKQQREESGKIKEALLKKPHTLHFVDHPEAGPDKVQDNLHFKEPKEAGPDKVQDNLHFKEPKEAGPRKDPKKSKKKKDEEEDVSKTLFLDSSVYFKKSFRSLDDIRKAVYVKDKSGKLSGASVGPITQSRKEQRAGEEKFKKDISRQKFLVGEKTAPEDMTSIGKFIQDNSGALINMALMHPGAAAASTTGKLATGGGAILSSLIKEHGLKFTKVAADAVRTPVMVAMLSLPGPVGRKIVQGAGAASRSKWALTASSEEAAKQASKALAPQIKTVVTATQKAAPTAAKKVAETATKAAPTAAKKVAETATKASAKAKIAATAAAASATKAATTAPATTEPPPPTTAEAPAPTTAEAPAPTSKPKKKPKGKSRLLPLLALDSPGEEEEESSKGRGRALSTTKQASQEGSKSRRGRASKDRAIAAALAAASKEQRKTQAKARGESYSTQGRRKKFSEFQERSERLGGAPKQKATETRDLFASLSASHSGQYFEKSAAFVAPYARQVMNKKMSLTAALDKVPWWMQDELLEYLRSKKKKG